MILPFPEQRSTRLSQAQGGDPSAFEELMRLHDAKALRVALRILGQMADAQDICQEAFLRLHRELRGFSDESEIGPWLYRVVVNLCCDETRRRKRARTVELTPVSSPSAETHLSQRQLVERAMSVLTQKERAAITLRELEGFTTAEIAELFGTVESTVRVQIAAARMKIRRFLEAL